MKFHNMRYDFYNEPIFSIDDLNDPNGLLRWLCFWFTRASFEESPLGPCAFIDLQIFSNTENKKIAALAVTKGYLTIINYPDQNYECKLTEVGKKMTTLYVMFKAL